MNKQLLSGHGFSAAGGCCPCPCPCRVSFGRRCTLCPPLLKVPQSSVVEALLKVSGGWPPYIHFPLFKASLQHCMQRAGSRLATTAASSVPSSQSQNCASCCIFELPTSAKKPTVFASLSIMKESLLVGAAPSVGKTHKHTHTHLVALLGGRPTTARQQEEYLRT